MKLVSYLFIVVLASGCASIVKTSDDEDAAGIRYALPINHLRITVVTEVDYPDKPSFKSEHTFLVNAVLVDDSTKSKIKSSARRQGLNDSFFVPDIVFAADLSGQTERYLAQCYEVAEKTTKGKITDISKIQISDFSGGYSLYVEPNFFADSDVSIGRDKNAYLTTVSFSADGKADDVIVGATKLAGTIAGFTLAGPAGGFAGSQLGDNLFDIFVSKNNDTLNLLESDLAERGFDRNSLPQTLVSCKHFRKLLIASQDLGSFEEQMKDVVMEVALLSGKLDKSIFIQAASIRSAIELTDSRLVAIDNEIAKTSELDAIKALLEERRIRADNKGRLENLSSALASKIEAAQTYVLNLYEIKKDSSKTDIVDVDILDLVTRCYREENNDCDGTAVILPEDINDLTPIKSIFTEAGIAVTASLAKPNKFKSVAMSNVSDDDVAYVAYRDTETYLLTYYRLHREKHPLSGTIEVKWKPIKRSTHQLITARSPVGLVPYDASTLGKRDMSLTFDSGHLADYSYLSTSDAEALTTGLNNAAQGYIDNIAKAQKSRIDLISADQSAAQAELQFEIDTLSKQKQILENKNSLALLNTDEATELATIEQQILLLNQQKALIESQAGLAIAENTQQNSIDTAQYSSDLSAFLAMQSLQNAQSGSENAASQLMLLNMISSLQQSLIDDPDSDSLKNELQKLEIKLRVLLKELELKGLISGASEN